MTEQQPYDILTSYDDFEIRLYPDHVVVDAAMTGDFFEAGSRGFRPLFGYISGDNSAGQKFSMTAPVLQAPQSGAAHRVSFVLPAGVDAATVPGSSNSNVSTRAVPAHRVAARRFSGGSSEERYQQNAEVLLAGLAREGIALAGEVYFARYDAPWKPGFLKHNEALVAVAASDDIPL